MSFLGRLFSRPSSRASLALREGRYEDAATLFVEQGEIDAALNARHRQVELCADAWSRIDVSRAAYRLSLEHHHDRTVALGLELAQALVDWVGSAKLNDERDRNVLLEAAELCRAAGQLERCGDLLREAGQPRKAAEVFEEVGCVEKMDLAYLEDELGRGVDAQREAWIKKFEDAKLFGDLLGARRAIEAATKLPDPPLALVELHDTFMRSMPTNHDVRLEIDGWGRINLLFGDWLTVGRAEDAHITLLAQGVSRRHVRLVRTDAGVFVEDLGSKHGTDLDGEGCSERTPLAKKGTLGVGPNCRLRFERQETWTLFTLEGVENTLFVWGDRWSSSELPAISAFVQEGCWFLEPTRGLFADGDLVDSPLLLRDGVTLTHGGPPARTILCTLRPRPNDRA